MSKTIEKNGPEKKAYSRALGTVLFAAILCGFAHLADAASYTWNVGSGNWSAPSSWSPAAPSGGPAASDVVTFGATGASGDPGTINNTVDAAFAGTVSGLTYNSTDATLYNVTEIPSGQTLTVTGSVTIGQQNGVKLVTQAYFTGDGTLIANVTNFTVQNYGSAAGANSTANLNLSGLNTFVLNNPGGTLSIADTSSGLTRAGGNLVLAGVSNFITISNINLATSVAAQAGPLSSLTFGAGTNIINTANFNIANNKGSANVTFAAPTGGLKIRGIGGTDADRANIAIGNRNQTGTGTTTGTLIANGNPLNIKAATLAIGANPNTGTPGAAGDFGVGILQFDTGTVDATTVNIASSATANLGSTSGTLTVGPNAKLIVGAGGLSLLNQSAAENAGFACSGTLNISNGVVNCAGNLVVTTNNASGPGGAGTSTINFIDGGTLSMGSGSVIGTTTSPIDNFNLVENSTLEFGSPLAGQTNMVVNTLAWPVNDSALTITIDGFSGVTNGSVIPLISFASMVGGTYVAPVLNLPAGITGSLSLVGNTIWLTVTSGIVPGVGGQNQLANPGFELSPSKVGWTAVGNTPVITVGSATYYNQGTCGTDPTPELVLSHDGTNVANIYGNFTGAKNTSSWSQEMSTAAGTTFEAGAYTYVSHEDLMSGSDSFWYEVDFTDDNGSLLASYESFVVTNLDCGQVAPFAVDTWNFLGVTNIMQVVNGTNTGVVIGDVADGVLTAPPGTANVRFSAILLQQPDNAGGSVYFDDANLGRISGPVLPTLSSMSPNLVALSTNSAVTCTASSIASTIESVQVIVTSSSLGGFSTMVTNTQDSPSVTVTGLGTDTANISYELTPNMLYTIVIKATDANGITVSSSANTLDTLSPNLVIEAADFNFSGGSFLDTPADGGLWLYANQVGTQDIDENKAVRTSAQIYRPAPEAVVIQVAAPNTGTPPTATEQKFVTAAANGNTNQVETEVGYNSAGDWLNYTRNYGSGGSAPAGTYNVWCYLATSGSGVQATLSMVTSDPTQPNQTTNFLGYFGTAAFTDNGYNNYRYVPLTDQYGNRVSVTFTNGQQTLKSTVVGNPNLGFYILVPVAPVLTPVLQYSYPNGSTPYQSSGQFTFTVGPADGAPIETSGIHLVLNGVDVSSGLTFTQQDGSWIASYSIQSNELYAATINITNTDGLHSTFSSSFDTFDVNNYQWEAVDYDFSINNGGTLIGAQFIDNPVPTGDINITQTGAMAPNSYFGFPGGDGTATAQEGVDMHWPDLQPAASSWYRADSVGTQPATDYLRLKFREAQTNFSDPNIGQFNIGYFNAGNWLNYTRNYPTNTYNIWARLAGGAGPFSGTTLSVVTSGVGTTDQTADVLGTFSDPNPEGWQVFHYIPLLDTNGNKVVIQLGGKETLRLTSGNNLNALFFMLTPAVAVPPMFNISATLVGTDIQISIPTETGHNYTLWHADSLPATSWTPVGGGIVGDGSVHVITQPAIGQGYYRVSVQ
jgi:hypothetical protein